MHITANTDEELIEKAQKVAQEQNAYVHMDILPSLGGKPRANVRVDEIDTPFLHVMKHTQSHYNFNEGTWNEM